MTEHPHNWSGWPGAHCLDCGAGQALEIALADNWFDPISGEYISEEHKRLIELCDIYCEAKMSEEEYAPIRAEIRLLEKKHYTPNPNKS